MQYLNNEIEALTKRKKTATLIKKQVSCGVFQEVDDIPQPKRTERKETL